jgi:antitoxin component YwqK of YwqJK toxin-antitoxin module
LKIVKKIRRGDKKKMVSIVNYYYNGKMIERRSKANNFTMGYYENGQIAWRKDLSDFALEGAGIANVGFDIGGRFSSIDTCAWLKKNGFCMNFAENSKVASHGVYRDGHKHDKYFVTYHSNSRHEDPRADRIKSICGYKLGKKHGPALHYSKTLALTSKIHYFQGLPTGDSNHIFKRVSSPLVPSNRDTEYRGSMTKTLDYYNGAERIYTKRHKIGLFEIILYTKSIPRKQESQYDLTTGKIH